MEMFNHESVGSSSDVGNVQRFGEMFYICMFPIRFIILH